MAPPIAPGAGGGDAFYRAFPWAKPTLLKPERGARIGFSITLPNQLHCRAARKAATRKKECKP